jgi:hypothetical protein
MGYVTKNQPIGSDIVINEIIKTMYESLIDSGWTGYEAYHRVYKNPKAGGNLYTPEAYTEQSENSNGDYQEVLLDDNQNSTSFFVTGDTTTYTNGIYKLPISVIFQVNLKELYGDIEHLPDEEARNDAIVAIRKSVNGRSNITSVVTHVPNVYNEFDTSQSRLDDMFPFHVFRINMEVPVNYNCCYKCTYGESGGFQYVLNFGMN